MVDPAFGSDSFNTPKYLNEMMTIATNIITILQARPGFFPSQPELGMNIKQLLYKDIDDIDTDAIKVELVRHCSTFIKNVRDGSFDVQKVIYQQKPLLVFVVPVEIKRARQRIAIGTTINANGEMVFKIETVSDYD